MPAPCWHLLRQPAGRRHAHSVKRPPKPLLRTAGHVIRAHLAARGGSSSVAETDARPVRCPDRRPGCRAGRLTRPADQEVQLSSSPCRRSWRLRSCSRVLPSRAGPCVSTSPGTTARPSSGRDTLSAISRAGRKCTARPTRIMLRKPFSRSASKSLRADWRATRSLKCYYVTK